MFSITGTGYNYLLNQSSIDFNVGGYAYSGTSILNHSASNYGRLPIRIRLGVKNNTLCIILTSLASNGKWEYPKFTLNATIGYTLPPDSWKDGWTSSMVLEADLTTAGITAIIEPSMVDVNKELNANASALSTLTSDVSLIDGRVTATSKDVTNLSTAIGGNKASISTLASSVDGIKSEYSVKLDSNGKVSGIGMINDGKKSDFSVNADTFKVSNGSSDIAPFTVSNNEVIFNGKVNFTNITNRAWKLTVVGTSLALPPDERKSITYIDDSNYSEDNGTSVRGVRVTVYDKDKNARFNNLYDTYTASGCSQFKNDVSSLNLDGLIVTVRSMDATLANNQDFIDGMNKLGLDGNGINSSLRYNVRTSFCSISQYIASENSRNNIIVINGDEEGKQKKAIVTASIKDGKLIPESYSTNTGMHKLNDAANIAID